MFTRDSETKNRIASLTGSEVCAVSSPRDHRGHDRRRSIKPTTVLSLIITVDVVLVVMFLNEYTDRSINGSTFQGVELAYVITILIGGSRPWTSW